MFALWKGGKNLHILDGVSFPGGRQIDKLRPYKDDQLHPEVERGKRWDNFGASLFCGCESLKKLFTIPLEQTGRRRSHRASVPGATGDGVPRGTGNIDHRHHHP